jgi:hypothetical protein
LPQPKQEKQYIQLYINAAFPSYYPSNAIVFSTEVQITLREEEM